MTKLTESEQKGRGIVYLVGAGPGDPGLLTLRGAELLESAQVVVYDHLANPALLAHCPQARAIYVGKQSSSHSKTQDEINAILVDEARAGNRVVRLKGGDPFIFGRGGEECQVLAEAGLRFEVVPGITASVAAAAYAGIPVTHRDFNTSFTVITGHEQEGGRGGDGIDWTAISRLPCVAFYMGVASLPHICAKLIEHGKPATTPAATIQWGTTPRQRTVTATLADLPARVSAAGLGPPAITIVGGAIALRPALNWFENRPLFGQTIAVLRTREQASDLSRKLTDRGAAVIEAPTIQLRPPSNWSAVDAALAAAGKFDWIIFTSANGVRFTKQRLLELNRDVRDFGAAKIAAIGDATAAALRDELSLRVDLSPKQFVAEALADELIAGGHVAGRRFLLLRADIARPILVEKLKSAGAGEVCDVSIYETHPAPSLPPEMLTAVESKALTWITFASASSAKNLASLLGPDYRARLTGIKLASIGPITTAALRELGLEPTVQAETYNIDGLIAAMQK
ncbi:MAG TPA: uroporphyrinogen-III C-methyltransferase [Tepidisphaeraceae bacterium]|nr:uroporphyrinogen-III C-methyltransferase [Tepidisphaeraceae bacterium]